MAFFLVHPAGFTASIRNIRIPANSRAIRHFGCPATVS